MEDQILGLLSTPIGIGLIIWWVKSALKKAVKKIEDSASKKDLEDAEKKQADHNKKLYEKTDKHAEDIAELRGQLKK